MMGNLGHKHYYAEQNNKLFFYNIKQFHNRVEKQYYQNSIQL